MQYTGLKDKNGVEIYEGDIVNYKEAYPDEGYLWRAIIIWNNDEFRYEFKNVDSDWVESFIDCDPVDFSTLEVIGNIYENPELMGANNGN